METATSKTQVVKDFNEKSVVVSREFNAPVADVWRCYTEKELLDQWWGPQPWRAETKHMDFRVGGSWLYAMVSPEGEKHWACMNYLTIEPHQHFTMQDFFSDENGNPLPGMPYAHGSNTFTKTANGTTVDFKIVYQSEEDLKKIIEMGFEQGISMCIEQLVSLLSKTKL